MSKLIPGENTLKIPGKRLDVVIMAAANVSQKMKTGEVFAIFSLCELVIMSKYFISDFQISDFSYFVAEK
jgi:hypothetical protein